MTFLRDRSRTSMDPDDVRHPRRNMGVGGPDRSHLCRLLRSDFGTVAVLV